LGEMIRGAEDLTPAERERFLDAIGGHADKARQVAQVAPIFDVRVQGVRRFGTQFASGHVTLRLNTSAPSALAAPRWTWVSGHVRMWSGDHGASSVTPTTAFATG
jgi:hypothetical protein